MLCRYGGEAFRVGEKPVTVEVIEAVLSRQIDDLAGRARRRPRPRAHGSDAGGRPAPVSMSTQSDVLDGTASPRARVSRLSGLESVSFRMAGKVARRNFNERRPPCRHYVRG